jgi:hypothetical protein
MLRRLFRRRPPDSLEVTHEEVKRTFGDGRVEAVRWDRLTAVLIKTTSEGPFAEDIFFVLVESPESGCVVPQSLATDELVSRLQSLPGFDNAQMIEAMGSTAESDFVVWRRDG